MGRWSGGLLDAGRACISLMRCRGLLARGEAIPLMGVQGGCTALPEIPPTALSEPPSLTPVACGCSRSLSPAKAPPLCPSGEKDLDKILDLTFWVNTQISTLVFLFVKSERIIYASECHLEE